MLFKFFADGAGSPLYGQGSKNSASEYVKYLNLGRVQNFYDFVDVSSSDDARLIDLDVFVSFMNDCPR